MVGKRVYVDYPGQFRLLEPGEYVLRGKKWYACTPNGYHCNLAAHTIAEHSDGTITVSPSIAVRMGDGEGGEKEVWHGFLEKGVWRSC